MRTHVLILCLALFAACSESSSPVVPAGPDISGEPDIPEEPAELLEKYRFKLAVDESCVNIFEPLKLSLFRQDNEQLVVNYSEMSKVYDSIQWSVPGLEGRSQLFEWKRENGFQARFTIGWVHFFYLPGNYATCLAGYKDGKVVHSDTLRVKVTDNHQFLTTDWNRFVPSDNFIGYSNSLDDDNMLLINAVYHEQTPSLTVRLNLTEEDQEQYAGRVEKALRNYITTLYGTPSYEGEPAEKTYNELFFHKTESARACVLWLTTHTRIALVESDDPYWPDCWIYAEPQE